MNGKTNPVFSGMAFLMVSGVSKKEKEIFTVKNISFSQQPMQNIAIAGETGSGKTTLLKMIGGLVQPDAGEIKFEDIRVKGPFEKLLPGHPAIAYLSQQFELRNNYYVQEILSYSNQLTEQQATAIYAVCRIDHLLSRRTDQLSGGEKQRIALAKLLIASPKLLLLDEPFSNLDSIHKNIIRAVLADIREKLQVSCIMVSHDAPDILAWADTIIILKEGEIIQQGKPEEIYFKPVNEYCAALFGEYNLVDAAIFNQAIGHNEKEKKIIVRPEQILINKSSSEGIQVTVKAVQFSGSFYIVYAMAGDTQLMLKTTSMDLSPGDTIYLSLRQDVFFQQ